MDKCLEITASYAPVMEKMNEVAPYTYRADLLQMSHHFFFFQFGAHPGSVPCHALSFTGPHPTPPNPHLDPINSCSTFTTKDPTSSPSPHTHFQLQVIAELDVIVALAHVSVNAPTPYCRPTMLEQGGGVLELKAARHPCVEMMENVEFIPNDVVLKKGTVTNSVLLGGGRFVIFFVFSAYSL